MQEERDHGWQRGRLDLLAPTNQEDGEEEAEAGLIEVHCRDYCFEHGRI